MVKLATHKKTGKKVAIKTVHKKDMKPIEIYQQRREIDVLKMSQHPNIVGLVDVGLFWDPPNRPGCNGQSPKD